MEKHINTIKASYEALIDSYTTNDAIKKALNANFAKVVTAINTMNDTLLFSNEEIKDLKLYNQKAWNDTYLECLKTSKEAYTLKIKGE